MGGFFGFIFNQLTFKPKPLPATVKLEGQTAIVTGANVGLGLEASRQLAQHGLAHLILGVRDTAKGETAKADIQKVNPNVNIEVWKVDNESFESITDFAERAATLDRIDIVILNAGVKQLKYTTSPTGHESNVQINHLGTSLLSLLLLPHLKASTKKTGNVARLTITSSEVHFWTPFKEHTAENILARMDQKDSFKEGDMERYYSSKLLNVLWERELASKVDSNEVIINTVNPGFCYSSLHRHDQSGGIKLFLKLFAWSSAQGGNCLTDAAVTKKAETHGGYLSEQKQKDPSKFVLSSQGQTAQKKLWNETIALLQKEAPKADISAFAP